MAFPYATAGRRIWGRPTPPAFQVRLHDPARGEETIADIPRVLTAAHRVKDFEVSNNPARAQSEADRQQSLLLALIAGISLVVVGIGMMNIMLMAVKERTREIGLRMAVGARQQDIRFQFLTEAVMVSPIGLVFGYMPARTAARLDPVVAPGGE